MASLLLILAPTLAYATSQDRQGTVLDSPLEARCQVICQTFEQKGSGLSTQCMGSEFKINRFSKKKRIQNQDSPRVWRIREERVCS
jgi:hypothetical protein